MTYINLITNESEYQYAITRLDELMNLEPAENSNEGLELEALALLIQSYEKKHYPFPTDDITALDMIQFKMEQNNLTPKDMTKYLGSPSKVSEVLSGKRSLSLTMIKKLYHGLGIPAQLLLA